MDWGAQPRTFWWLLGSACAMVLGGFAPWATAFGALNVSGTNGDGWILIVGGVIAVVLTIRHVARQGRRLWPMICVGLIGVVGAIVAIVDLADISSATDSSQAFGDVVRPGWGLWMSLAAATSLAAASIGPLWRTRGRGEDPAPPLGGGELDA